MGQTFVPAEKDSYAGDPRTEIKYRVSDAAAPARVYLDILDEGQPVPSVITELAPIDAFALGEALIDASSIAPAESEAPELEGPGVDLAIVAQRIEAFEAVTDRLRVVTELIRAASAAGASAPNITVDAPRAFREIVGLS